MLKQVVTTSKSYTEQHTMSKVTNQAGFSFYISVDQSKSKEISIDETFSKESNTF
jgi:hypothetical protein